MARGLLCYEQNTDERNGGERHTAFPPRRTFVTTSTIERVPNNTSDEVNARILTQTKDNVIRISKQGPRAIDQRLVELDREWDIERMLETNAASAILLGTALGAFVHKRFFLLPALVSGFLLQHALQGWCPPLPLFRRMGVRTAAEIDQERYALKALRGDFASSQSHGEKTNAIRALAAARR